VSIELGECGVEVSILGLLLLGEHLLIAEFNLVEELIANSEPISSFLELIKEAESIEMDSVALTDFLFALHKFVLKILMILNISEDFTLSII
jgi:hypothetical protein